MIPSKYQQSVYNFTELGTANLLVEAVAGSGKTTTMELAIREHTSGMDRTLVCAFNKHIADAASKRMPSNVECSTINAFGWRGYKREYSTARLEPNKNKRIVESILQTDWDDKDQVKRFYKLFYPIDRIITLTKALAKRNVDDFDFICENWDVLLPDDEHFEEILRICWNASVRDSYVLDFSDQVYYPFYFETKLPRYDNVWVDESQDLNPLQMELVKKIANRALFVGDSYQAIYGFRGASPDAMQKVEGMFNTTNLPLSICYRCSKAVVVEAQKIVPHIEAHESAPEGSVSYLNIRDYHKYLTPGTWVLCRTTAPLVHHCLQLIRMGRNAVVLGREIGEQLVWFVERVTDRKNVRTDSFLVRLQAKYEEAAPKLRQLGKDQQLQALEDTVETLKCFAEDCDDTDGIIKRIESVFTNETHGKITFATLHKSKGLEADRIIFICPELVPHKAAKKEWQVKQEWNLKYVGVTRARKDLIYASKEF